MAIQYIATYNENDATQCYDYSTQGLVPTLVNKLTIGASDIGYKAAYNGTDSEVTYGDVLNFGGTALMSIFVKIKVTAGLTHVIVDKSLQYQLSINASNKVLFGVDVGAGLVTLTSTASIVNETWITIGAVYNGVDTLLYFNGVLDSSQNQVGNLRASTAIVSIGSNTSGGGSNFLTGDIEIISAYSQALVVTEVKSLHDKPGGIKTDMPDSTDFANGDLLEVSAKGTATGAQCVVTGDLGSNQLLILPIANDIPEKGDIIRHAGNIYTASRQCLMRTTLSSSAPVTKFYSGVNTFTLPTPVVKIDCNGIVNPADPTNPTKVLRGDGTWGYVRLFSQYALKTITNTTTKTTLFGTGEGSPIVPAGYFDELGVMANLIMMGSWAKSTGGALILLIEITDSAGTTEIHRKSFSNAQLGGGGTTSGHWEIRMLSTCYATGATGSLMTHASLSLLENNSAEILGVHSETSQVTVDFTGTIEMVVTAQWDTASTSLSIGSANVILKAQ